MIHRRQSLLELEHLSNLPPTMHQAATLDGFTVARIQRLWENWLRNNVPEQRNKHRFHQHIIKHEAGLANVRLATIYVVLARYDAAPHTPVEPSLICH